MLWTSRRSMNSVTRYGAFGRKTSQSEKTDARTRTPSAASRRLLDRVVIIFASVVTRDGGEAAKVARGREREALPVKARPFAGHGARSAPDQSAGYARRRRSRKG